MENGFYAMMSRMRLIERWSLMRNTSSENIAEHSLQVTVIAQALCLIRQTYTRSDEPEAIDPEHAMALAVFHDSSEIITGDMPTPIKYFSPTMREAYQQVEAEASESLLTMLPEELREHYRSYILPDPDKEKEALRLVKAADSISAYLKCVEEERQGNTEFIEARQQTEEKIRAMELPEADYFMEHFAPAFAYSLDKLKN